MVALRRRTSSGPSQEPSQIPTKVKNEELIVEGIPEENAEANHDHEIISNSPISSIKRPFKLVGSFPCSDSRPIYSRIKNPLSIKDAAVLYASLRQSREFWISGGPSFELYWSKSQERQQKYALSKLENSMVKTESENHDDTENSFNLEDKKSNIRDRMNKLCDCTMVAGPHIFDIRLFILKDDEVERKHELELKQKKVEKQKKKLEREEEQKRRAELRQKKKLEDDKKKEALKVEKDKLERENQAAGTVKIHNGADANAKIESSPKINNKAKTSQVFEKQKSKTANDVMQTPENTIMIKNLNAIARIDPYLDALMKVVASGKSNPPQIHEFQGYIRKARDMGRRKIEDPKVFFRVLEDEAKCQLINKSQVNSTLNNTPDSNDSKQKQAKAKKMKLSEEELKKKKEEKKAAKQLLKENMNKEKESKLTAFQERYVKNADLVFEYSEAPTERFRVPKESIIEQVGESQLLISFIVIVGERSEELYKELLKAEEEKQIEEKQRIKEEKKLEEGKSKSEEGREKDDDVEIKDGKGTKDETKNDGDNVELKNDEENKEIKKEEKPQEKKAKEEVKSKKRGPKRRAKKKYVSRKSRRLAAIEKEKEKENRLNPLDSDYSEDDEENEDDEAERETIKFVSISLSYQDIPLRYIELIKNSFAPQEKVYKKMEFIIKNGTKVPSYYLWYTLDGNQDEKVSENIRHQLFDLENGKEKKKYNKGPRPMATLTAVVASTLPPAALPTNILANPSLTPDSVKK